MNLRRYIVSIGLLLAAWIAPVVAQEYVAIVCAGDTAVSYFVEGGDESTFEWTIEGGVITRDYNDSIIVDWGMTAGVYELSVQETSEYGCISEPRTAKIFVSTPSVELGDDTYVCAGETFSVEPRGEDLYYSYEWQDGSSGSSFSTTEEGLISVKVSDSLGCYAEDELYLEVKPLPEVYLGRDTSLCGEQVLYLNGGDDASLFEWSTGENSYEIEAYQGRKVIWVVVEDDYGCVNSDTMTIYDCDPSAFFNDIPTAITPNGDGHNDTWRLQKLEAYPDAVIEIFDRWGRMVYKSESGYTTPWDGRDMNGDLVPMDSYHFVILLNFGGDDQYVGAVTVIR